MRNYRDMSIAEAINDRQAQSAYAFATGFDLVGSWQTAERDARRARWQRRKSSK